MKAQLVELVSREDSVQARAGTWFARLGEDTYLADAITRWNEEGGQFPKGLALYAWLRMGFNPTSEDDVMVVVWSAAGTLLDRFALNTPPPGRLPRGAPDPRAEDDSTIEVEGGRDNALRSVVGRQRVRSADGKLLGTVTVIVPDAMAVELEGLTPRIAARPSEEGRRGGRAHALWLSLVSDGRVVASDDPEARWFEPPTLPAASELADPTWLEPSEASGGRPWAAVSAGDRGILVARLADAGADRLLFALARVLVVGAGAGTILALVVLAFGLRGWRPRLQDKILGSYFLISVLPLLFLGYANWRDALARNEEQFRRRQETLVRAARADLEAQPPDQRSFASLPTYGQVYSADFSLYVNGDVRSTSLRGLVDAELLPARLPASVFQATELDGRAFAVRDETFAGRTVRVGYAPILDAPGRPWGTVSVPLIYDSESAEQQAAETGSVLLAAYLLTLVLVVVIGMYTSRSLAKPLDDLAEGTKRVAAGELDLAIPGRRGDELGTLVNAFNSMTGELRSARDRAAKAEREAAWRGMARQVAHEIKNPLTPMKLMLQQLQATAKTDPAFAREMLEPTTRVLLEQIDALSRIASDFAAFARFPPRTLRPCDLNDVLRSVVALYGTEQARGDGHRRPRRRAPAGPVGPGRAAPGVPQPGGERGPGPRPGEGPGARGGALAPRERPGDGETGDPRDDHGRRGRDPAREPGAPLRARLQHEEQRHGPRARDLPPDPRGPRGGDPDRLGAGRGHDRLLLVPRRSARGAPRPPGRRSRPTVARRGRTAGTPPFHRISATLDSSP